MTPSPEPDELSVRVTVLCEPGVTREEARSIALAIEAYAQNCRGVSHSYEREVYNLDDLEPGDA